MSESTFTAEMRAAAKRRCEAATPGWWERYGVMGRAGLTRVRVEVAMDRTGRAVYQEIPGTEADSMFLVNAREDLLAALAEIERLEAIIAKLPVTADGVPVVPGMRVWRIEHQTTLGESVLDVSLRGIHLVGKSDWYESRDVCSTREAAEAAGGE